MNTLTLHDHPLSSCRHKALVAIAVLGIAVDKQRLHLGDPDARASHLTL
jgi:glutathione S-transferase